MSCRGFPFSITYMPLWGQYVPHATLTEVILPKPENEILADPNEKSCEKQIPTIQRNDRRY